MRIHYSVNGTGAKTVLLVHGWTCDETTWTEQVPVLAKQYRVVTLDLPGHGQSDSPKDLKFSMDLFARAIESVRKQIKVDRIVLVGHSMGTPVITEYARLYPEHTSALVIVDGVTGGNPQRERRRGAMMAGDDGPKNREAMVRGMFSASTTPALQARIMKMMMAAPEATAVGALDATFDATTHEQGILHVSTLAVYADHSRLADRSYLEAHFPGLEYTEIPGTGHFLMLEKPVEFNRLLLDFMSKDK